MPWIIRLIVCPLLLMCAFNSIAEQVPSKSVEQWRAQGHYFEHNQQRIFYRDSQTELTSAQHKPAIVFLHGFPTSSWDWHKLWALFKDDYRLITLDFLGFGFSDKPKSGYSIAYQADLVEQLLGHLGVTTAHLLVHDYGTYVSQELVARQQQWTPAQRPFVIQSLVMLNGVVYPQSLQLRPIQKALNSPFGWLVSQFVSFNRFSKNFSAVFGAGSQPDPAALKDYWYLITLNDGHRISHKLIHYYDESLQHSTRWVGALSKTDVPVMLITGLADPVAGKPMVDKFAELMPRQQVQVLAEIGHYPHVEDEQQVAAYYRAFLEKHTTRVGAPLHTRSDSEFSHAL